MLPDRPLTILVIGGGGREHALCWKLAQSKQVEVIYCAPGNGGTYGTAKTQNIDIAPLDIAGLTDFSVESKVDLVVVGPDDPLAAGVVDALQQKQIRVFGPRKSAARLESSKAYAKQFMAKAAIPTARFEICTSFAQASAIVKDNSWARVIKADGLALGKGVFVCDNQEDALEALSEILEKKRFGEAGAKVVIEERLSGEEISLLTLCDGKQIIPLAPSQDHKRRFDGDLGPNTGGMGAYAPVDLFSRCHKQVEAQVLGPLSKALASGSHLEEPFQGILYIGLLVVTTSEQKYRPYVLEFNARFGDPETQTLLPLLSSDLLPLLWACTEEGLHRMNIDWSGNAACCVCAVTENYPQDSSRGEPITLGPLPDSTVLFQAGTRMSEGQLVTNGGRILSVTGMAPSVEAAADKAYSALKSIHFSGMDYRSDIARRAVRSCQ